MKFAIDLEASLFKYYTNPELIEQNQEHEDEFSQRARGAKTRKKHLERSRRENVTEIILEPIEGLDPSDFTLNTEDLSLTAINSNERIAIKFYSEAGPKINVLETSRLFKKCRNAHAKLILEI